MENKTGKCTGDAMENKTGKCTGDCDKCPFIRWTTPRYFYEEPKPICTLEKE